MCSYVPLEYSGGPILSSPELVSLFWGWLSRSEISSLRSYLSSFAGYLSGAGAPPGFVPVIQQYGTQGATVGMSHVEAWSGFLLQTGTPIGLADGGNFVWSVGDYNGDGVADLYAIKVKQASSNTVEVHVLDGA